MKARALIGTDSAKAISLAMQAKEMAGEIEYPKGEAYALKNIGMVYYIKGMYGRNHLTIGTNPYKSLKV